IGQHISGEEAVVDGKRASVYVANGIDEADHPACPAEVQPRQRARFAETGEVEEGVAGQHTVTAFDEPVVELHLLLGGRVQFVPHISAAAGGTQPGDAQRGTVICCQSGEFVELVNVVSSDDNRDLGVFEAGGGQVLQRSGGHRKRASATHGVV